MKLISKRFYKYYILILSFISVSFCLKAQSEALSVGSFIINMGATNPNTIANGIKPYGMIYDLIRNHKVPVKWVISQTKVKDGVDFVYNGVQYKGGTFIIPAEFRNAAVNARITFWTGQGVVGVTTTSTLTVDVTETIKAAPRWTLDAQNGSIAEGYLINAGVTNTAFPGAYNWKLPSALNSCDDFFVMPHADPTWATHSNLLSWNLNSLGSIWAACHATSALENMVNPANRAQQTNFLTQKVAGLAGTSGNYALSNSLILWGSHAGGSVPYIHQFPSDPVAQYLGVTDAAHQNGSEQIDIPNQSATGGWNVGAKIIAYDPTQVNVTNPLRPDKTNAAALIVYGRGFDDPSRGYVMYQPAHSHNKGSVNDVAAQRAFWNFSFFQIQPKAPQLSFSGITGGQSINGGATITGLNVSASSPLAGITFTYQWSSSCGGTFSNPTGTTTNFTAPVVGATTSCVISCAVTDNCGRTSFQSFPVTILGAAPPTANPDVQSVDPGCGAVSLTYNVLSNDTEPDGQPMTLTNVTGVGNGNISFTASGNITYTSNAGFVGVETLTYTVCDNTSPAPLCSNGTYTINVGNPANVPNAVNDAFTIAEDAIGTFNVLANDLPVVSGPYDVSAITNGPSNGRVSINTDNTITYVPNADYAGTDNFTYRIVNSIGYSRTATVTVTVTNDACDGGTLQSGSAAATLVSGNEWLKVYTRPVNTGGTNLTNTLAYNINAGMNRLLVVAISAGGPNGIAAVPTVTWGGQALTSLSVNRIDNNRSHAFIFYLKESGIAGASGNNLIVNMGVPSYFGYVVHAAVYQNVDQTTTVQNAVSPDISGNSLASPITAAATANFAAGDQGIFVSGYSVNGGTAVATYSSVSTNWTGSATLFGGATSSSGAVGPYYGGVGVRNITTAATNETVSMTVTATNSLRPSITVVSIIPGGLTCAAIPNRAPLGMQDTATTNSSTAVIIPVATNDQLFGQPVTSVTISTASSNGSATVIGNTIQYTPSGSFNGVATLQYTITTANGSDVVRVYINVTGTPINANDDTPAGALSGVVQTINVKANDIDPEGTASSTVTIAVNPKNGTATVNGSGQIVYTPNAGFTGNDTLSYSICEPAPACGVAACDTAKVFLTVQNRAPVANNDSKTILPCYTNTINLTGNDTDPENGALTVTNLSALSNPAAGTLVNNNDGTVTYSPAVGYTGTFTFTYTVTDNGVTPLVSAPATVTITVQNPVNTPPNAVNDAENTNMDQVLYFSVRDNDTDPENNPLTIPDITTPPLHGTASVNSVNGQIIYTPNPGFYGTDSLRYRICDIPILIVATCSSGPDLCDTATLIITVDAPNTVIAINDENSTWINTPVSGGTLGNDFDPQGDSPITFNGFIIGGTSYTSGTIAVSGFDMNGVPVPNAGTITINANGTYTFTPALNFTGVVNVPYSIRDNNLNTAVDTANLRITVNPLPGVANSVIANNDENRVFGGATVSSTLFANDRDPQSNPFTVTGYMYDTNGDGTPDGTGTLGAPVTVGGVTTSGLQVSNAGLLTINANGTYTFTPAPDFTGSIDVPYTICDNIVPPACATAILHIDVLVDANGPLNDPPQPGDDFAYTKINTPVTSTFITNDGDPNNDPVSLNGTTINTGGPATPIGAPVTTAKGGTVQYFANGTYTYTPPAGYVGPDSVEYEICDVTAVAPQPLCNKAFLHLLVGVSNTTDAINDENSTWQDVNVSGNVLNNDFDAEGHTQTFGSFLLQNQSGDLASGAVLGGVDKSGVPIANAGTLTFDANGNFTFDPDPAFTGTVTVPYRLCDNGNQSKCDTAFLTITVDPLPNTGLNSVIANNDENVSYGAAVGGSLFVNDRDPQNDAFTVTSFVGGTVGTPGIVAGVDLNGNPVANAGTLTINANGTYTFTPAPGFVGSINVPYTITDANGATSTAVLHIDVLSDPNGILNDPPVAGDDFGYTTINKPVTGNFISNDSDPNTDPVSYMGITINPAGPATPIGTPVTTAQGGTVQFYANGTYLYTPPAGYIGPDRLPYTICDVTAVLPQPLCADATLHLLVGPGINIAGRVWDDANGNVNINGGENFTNAGNTLYVNLVDGSGNVVATTPVAADGTYSFANINPGDNYSLQLSINQGTVGNPAPAVALPPGWTNTGENRNGTIDGGTPGVIDTRNFGFTNTINFDFGIEQLPNTNNHTTTIPQPLVGTVVVLNGGANPPVLSGIDPEDCNAGCTLTTRSVIIDAVPANSDLYYNGVLVTNGQLINNFDPNLLEIRMTVATIGSLSTSFQYSYVDLAGKKDPTPATYTLNWLFPLPITLTSFTGIANKCDAVLQWKTSQEINADKFEVEQSNNGLNFTKLAEVKSANNANGRSYQLSVSQPNSLKYYRLKMLDRDGSYRYSPIITVRTNCTSADYMTAYPNPVSTNLTVSFQTVYKGQATLQIINAVGQQMVSQKIQITSSANTINLDMTNYVPGLYLLNLLNDSGEKIGETQKIIKR